MFKTVFMKTKNNMVVVVIISPPREDHVKKRERMNAVRH